MLASLWQNPANVLDVDASGLVTPVDALLVINALRERGSHVLPSSGPLEPPPYLDVDGNGAVWPVDALLVINALRMAEEPMAVTAYLATGSEPDGNAVVLTPTFTSFSQAADEAGRSRIYGGIHFEFDNSAGLAAGRAVGEHVVENFFAREELSVRMSC